MRWCVTRPGPKTALHTTQTKAPMNTTVDAEPKQILSGDGSSRRSTFATRASNEDNIIAAIAAQCRAATSTADMMRRNQTTTNNGASVICDLASGMPANTSKASSTSSPVSIGS